MAQDSAVVTGASAGIGAAFAVELAARGYPLILVARRGAALRDLARTLPVPTSVVAADLATRAGIAAVEAAIESADPPVGLLVNNAGLGTFASLAGQDPADLDATVEVNVHAPVRLTRAVLPRMVAEGRGGVIALSSPAARGKARLAAYSASKAFVDVFFEVVRQEVAETNVHVTVVSPSRTRSEWHARAGDLPAPGARWLEPSTVARLAVDAFEAGLPRLDIGPDQAPEVTAV